MMRNLKKKSWSFKYIHLLRAFRLNEGWTNLKGTRKAPCVCFWTKLEREEPEKKKQKLLEAGDFFLKKRTVESKLNCLALKPFVD